MKPLLRLVSRPAVKTLLREPKPVLKLLQPRFIAPQAYICQQCISHQSFRWYSENKRPSSESEQPTTISIENSPLSKGLREKEKTETESQSYVSPSSLDDGSSKAAKTKLPSEEDSRRANVMKRFSHVMDNFQSNIFIAGQRLNDLTGYSGIEALKKEIDELEQFSRESRKAVHDAKETYTAAIAQRSGSQREINELLQRKQAWSPQDLERFTSLYRSDHANEQAELAAQEALGSAERVAEEAGAQLSRTILARYHEEQIWSDKIRRMSTWGTWGLMGVNVLLFVIFQVAVEPWRRRRLVNGFEQKVREALEREGKPGVAAIAVSEGEHLVKPAEALTVEPITEGKTMKLNEAAAGSESFSSVVDAFPPQAESDLADALPTEISPPRPFETYKATFQDFFSERSITLKRVDITTIALEGAAAGAAAMGLIFILLRPR